MLRMPFDGFWKCHWNGHFASKFYCTQAMLGAGETDRVYRHEMWTNPNCEGQPWATYTSGKCYKDPDFGSHFYSCCVDCDASQGLLNLDADTVKC